MVGRVLGGLGPGQVSRLSVGPVISGENCLQDLKFVIVWSHVSLAPAKILNERRRRSNRISLFFSVVMLKLIQF